jgi:hypothetical protein
MSVANYLEAGTVIAGRSPSAPSRAIEFLERFLTETGTELRPVDEA